MNETRRKDTEYRGHRKFCVARFSMIREMGSVFAKPVRKGRLQTREKR